MKTLLASLFALILLLMIFVFFASQSKSPLKSSFITIQDVRGSAVQHQGKLYTLNFDQQKKIIALINDSLVSNQFFIKNPLTQSNNASEQIIFYLFNDSELHFFPQENKEIFHLQVAKNDQLYLIKLSQSQKFNHLLQNSYDP